MNLADKREMLATKQAELAFKKKEAEALKVQVKEATLDDETLTKLQENAQAVTDAMNALNDEVKSLGQEITDEEETLDEATKHLKEIKGAKQMTNYLKTKESAVEFAKLMSENQGKSLKQLRKEWEDHLTTKGVTGLENILPEPVLLSISNAFEDYQGVLNHISKDPRYSAKVAFQVIQNFGKGQKAGAVKKDSEVEYATYEINSATVYIKYAFDYADLKKDTQGTYFKHVMNELAQGFIRAVERAVVIGDGLAKNHEDKITDIISIAEETEANLFSTQEIDLSVSSYNQATLESLVAGIDQIAKNSNPILVTSKAVARKLKMVKDAEGRYIDPQPFAPISNTGNVINGFTVYVYDWMDGATNPILAFGDKSYTLIGDDVSADKFDEYDITVNRRHIELASVMGGRLSGFKSAVKFTQKAPAK